MSTWKKVRANPKWFRRGDAMRFTRGSMEILVVRRFDHIAVPPHTTLIVANGEPIRFRKQSAAMRAADQIEAIKRGVATYEEAVRIWRQRQAKNRKASRERHRKSRNPVGRPPLARTPSPIYSQRPRPRAPREKPAAVVVGRGPAGLDKAAVHPSLWPENAGTW